MWAAEAGGMQINGGPWGRGRLEETEEEASRVGTGVDYLPPSLQGCTQSMMTENTSLQAGARKHSGACYGAGNQGIAVSYLTHPQEKVSFPTATVQTEVL